MDEKMIEKIKPMAIINSLTNKVIKAELEIDGRRRSPSNPTSNQREDITPGSGLEVKFTNTDKTKTEFKVILKANTIPYDDDDNLLGVKVVLGKIRQIFEEINQKKIYRVPHHVETYQDLDSGEFTVIIHYHLVEGPIAVSDIHGIHIDPEIIHPDTP